jgi:hypothetical protein
MDEWLNANADGLALLFWAAVAGVFFLLVAALVERVVGPRWQRGEFKHATAVKRAKQQLARWVAAR